MNSGPGEMIGVLLGLALLVCALIVAAVWMYGKQSAKRRKELEAKRAGRAGDSPQG